MARDRKQLIERFAKLNAVYWDEQRENTSMAATAPKGDEAIFVYGNSLEELADRLEAACSK